MRHINKELIASYGSHFIDKNDINNVVSVLKGKHLTQGPTIEKFEKNFSKLVHANNTIVCSNGTAAIHLALIAVGIKKDDYVIVPSITFLAAANAVKYLGARIIFSDVNPRNGLVEPENLLETLDRCKRIGIYKKIKAFIPIHLNGNCTDLKEIQNICRKKKITIVEDSCHALGTKYKPIKSKQKHPIGSCKFSDISTFSFHPVKIIATGEGGAVTINNKQKANYLRKIRSHGIIKSENKLCFYKVKDLGFNYRLNDISCSLGLSQLKKINFFIKKRRKIVNYYKKKLKNLESFLDFIKVDKYCDPAWHIFVVLINFNKLKINKDKFLYYLKQKGIGIQVHYVPLIFQPLYKKEIKVSNYRGAKEYYSKALTLPLSIRMTLKDVEGRVKYIRQVIEKYKI